MEEEHNKVTLHGVLNSTFTKRVEFALKVKGIPYEFVVENLTNKSPLLLKYNPVHKKVPVLVHNAKPICESLIILEYIDEAWKNGAKLLPKDSYIRAQVRFWISYIQQQMFEAMTLVVSTDGETQEKAIKELYEKFEVLEKGMKDLFPNGTFDGKNVGFLDIIMCSVFGPYKVQEQVLGIKVIDQERNPIIFSWVTALNELPLVKEITPPHEELVAVLQTFRNFSLNLAMLDHLIAIKVCVLCSSC
ncbi:hypothetical protein UlMin_008256 [Ulmus minor]